MTSPADARRADGAPVYRAFGIGLQTDLALRTPLRTTSAPPDLRLERVDAPPPGARVEDGSLVFESAVRIDGGAPYLAIVAAGPWSVLRFSEVADFYVADDHIAYRLIDPAYAFTIELRLLGIVLAFWHERRGIPMLHASAVVVDGRGAGFMATNSGGKSTLAAALMQRGHPMLTDDVLGLRAGAGGVEGLPGYPAMRMWPDQAAHFVAAPETLPRAHPGHAKLRLPIDDPAGFGRFHDATAPMHAIYLPERRRPDDPDERVELVALSPQAAVMELVRGTFLPHVVERVGLATTRLALLGRMVRHVRVVRLRYPHGIARLPLVCDAIAADVLAHG